MLTKLLIMSLLAGAGADAGLTQRNYGPGFREHDPLMRSFTNHGTTPTVLGFSLTTGAKLGAGLALRHFHHSKLADLELALATEDSVSGAVTSARGYHKK